jgi:tetratricopeptide (TPR) repeat protein
VATKEKHLAAAQKFLQKNNLTRAIREYEQIVELDGRDFRSRQKLAELYSQTGEAEKALGQYEQVARYYADHAFYLKAIAVYKQMQKLSPASGEYTLKLARLNEQQGLVGNALAEYRLLLKQHEQAPDLAAAIEVLQAMQRLDPDNSAIGVRIASYCAQLGRQQEAHQAFWAVEQKVSGQGDFKQLQRLYEYFMQLWPQDLAIQTGYGRALLNHGEPLGGVQYLADLHRRHPEAAEVLSALAEGLRRCGEYRQEAACLAKLQQLQPGELDVCRRQAQALIDAEDFEACFLLLEPQRKAFFAAGEAARIKPFYERLRQEAPENREILEALRAVYEELGEGEKLFDVLSEATAPPTLAAETPADVLDFNSIDFETQSAVGDDSFEDLAFDLVDESAPSAATEFEDLAFDTLDEPAETAPALPAARLDLRAELEEVDFYLQQGLIDEAAQACDRLQQAAPDNDAVRQRLEQIAGRRRQLETASVPGPVITSSAAPAALPTSAEVPESLPPAGGTAEDLFADLDLSLGDDFQLEAATELADSQRGVQTVIADEDTDSAYNLGIAYKEMGLYDDAIAEFNKAMRDSRHRVASLCFKSACLVEQQQYDAAEEALTRGLSASGLTLQDRIVLYYETGMLYEACQRYADALASYQVVADKDADFRNVRLKIRELKALVGDTETAAEERVSYL